MVALWVRSVAFLSKSSYEAYKLVPLKLNLYEQNYFTAEFYQNISLHKTVDNDLNRLSHTCLPINFVLAKILSAASG